MSDRYPRMKGDIHTLVDLIATFPSYGDAPAIISFSEEGSREWTFSELSRLLERFAYGLASMGVGHGGRVALMAPNSPEWVAAALGILRAGGVVVPVDMHADEETLKHILQDSEARLFVTGTGQLEALEEAEGGHMPPTILLDAPEDDERNWRRVLREEALALPAVGPEDFAVQFYTSGTTGMPKGVPLTHGNLAFQLKAIEETKVLEADERVLMPLPLNHVYSFTVGTLAPLSVGLPVIQPHALTGPEVVRALKEGRGTLMVGVPRLYTALLQGIQGKAEAGGFLSKLYFGSALGLSLWLRKRFGWRTGRALLRPVHKRFAPGLRQVTSGGAALPTDVAWKLEGLGWRLAIGYGLTETSPLLTAKLPDADKFDTVGKPIPGVELRIDTATRTVEEESPAASNGRTERGEILAKGPSVFQGYHGLPEQTQEAFKDGWFRTGDLGYIDQDGFVHIEGRVSTVIVTESGKNIQPDEVEEAYAQHPVIKEAGVLGAQGKLVAVIVPEASMAASLGEDLESAVREAVEDQGRKLASYKRITDYVISLEPLPRTRLDKIRRHELKKRYEGIKHGQVVETAGAVPVEEMDEEDQAILQEPRARKVWDWLAERFADKRLTPDSNLQLDLGVDSLEWLSLTMDLSDRTGLVIDEEAIGRIETVRDLLEEVARVPEGEKKAVAPEAYLERPEEFLSDEQKRWITPLSPVQTAISWVLYALNWVLVRVMFRVKVEGVENLPKGQYVLTPNHLSYLDPFVLVSVMDYRRARNTYWAGWTGAAFGNALTRTFSRLSHVVPVDADQAVASSLAFGAAVLQKGYNLAWFPEGTRSKSGQLQAFKPGLGMLLERYSLPVVPAYIQGTYEAWPPHRMLPRPHKVRIVFGPPQDPKRLRKEGQGEESRRTMHALREKVRALAHGAERP